MSLAETELSLIFDGPEPVANIFIHGYSAVSTAQQMDRLSRYVLAARPPGKVFLLYWRSGNWRKPFAAPALTLGLRIFRISKMFHPVGLAADAAATIGMHSYQFKKKERLSEKLGAALPEILAEVSLLADLPINLLGHSLGGRVIQSAIAQDSWADLQLQDCIVMASAGDRDAYPWEQHVQKLSGAFYNAYSSNDLTLKMSPDLRSRVGRHPIPCTSPKIINVAFPEFRHTDYWPQLSHVLKETWPCYTPSPHVPIIIPPYPPPESEAS